MLEMNSELEGMLVLFRQECELLVAEAQRRIRDAQFDCIEGPIAIRNASHEEIRTGKTHDGKPVHVVRMAHQHELQGRPALQGNPGRDGQSIKGDRGEPGRDAMIRIESGDGHVKVIDVNNGKVAAEIVSVQIPTEIKVFPGEPDETVATISEDGKVLAEIRAKDGRDGRDGQRGTTGESGKSVTIRIGEVKTLSPSDKAYAKNIGTDTEIVLELGLPQGYAGDRGERGVTGSIGQPGVDGITKDGLTAEQIAAIVSKVVEETLAKHSAAYGSTVAAVSKEVRAQYSHSTNPEVQVALRPILRLLEVGEQARRDVKFVEEIEQRAAELQRTLAGK